jgi:hypothetical protein
MSERNTQEFLATARERFHIAQEAETNVRTKALEDTRFRVDQWPEDIRAQRTLERRPCIQVNRLNAFVKQVTNDQRQNRPCIQVNPVDDFGDPETAEVLQGIIKHIETRSNSDVAIDTAFEHAVTGGFGYLRVITEYPDPMSFDQDIRIVRIKNQFTVYFDPSCQEADYSDAQFAFIVEDISHAEFKAQYPDSELAGLTEFTSIGDRSASWLTKDSVRVAEYFYIEREQAEIALLASGEVVRLDQVPEGLQVLKTRIADIPVVRWAKINAIEILEETDWAGKWIPIVPVLGDELNVDGERHLVGLVRDAKDPARMINYWKSAQTEMIALAPRAPYVAAEGQLEGHEAAWAQANTRNQSVLQYKPKSVDGNLVPAPQRNVVEPPIQAISVALQQSVDDLKAATGIHDASLGAQGNETSGKAILARQQEGDTANFHFVDNLTRAIKHLGRILIDLIPKTYDTPRVLRIIGKDEQQRTVAINQPTTDKGVERIYDVTTGRYDVTVSVGPSYNSRRSQAVESMMQLTQAYPAIVPVAGDLMVANMDWPGAAQIAERLKKMLPPELQDEDGQQKQAVPPQVKAQMDALMQQHEQLTAALEQANEALQTKRLELDAKERMVTMQTQAQLIIKQAELGSREGIALLQAEIQALGTQMQSLAAERAEERAAAAEAEDGGGDEMPIAA